VDLVVVLQEKNIQVENIIFVLFVTNQLKKIKIRKLHELAKNFFIFAVKKIMRNG